MIHEKCDWLHKNKITIICENSANLNVWLKIEISEFLLLIIGMASYCLSYLWIFDYELHEMFSMYYLWMCMLFEDGCELLYEDVCELSFTR